MPTIEGAAIVPKAMLFLAARPGATSEAVESALSREAELVAQRAPGLRVEAAVRLPDAVMAELWELTADVAQSSVYQPEEYLPSPYAGVIGITGPPGSAAEVFASLDDAGERLTATFDPDASLAAAGTSETMIPVNDTWLYLNFLRRRRGDSEQYFHDYWRLYHTRFTMRIAGLSGYRQNHIVPTYSQQLAERAGVGQYDVDGVVEAYATGLDGFAEQWRWEMSNGVPGDELEFIDVERCSLGYYRWLA